MIIKGIRLRTTSGIKRTIRHVQNGEENESVNFLRGTPADIHDMHRDAANCKSTYAVRHWIVAPHYEMTRPQMGELLGMLAKEFEFDPARAVVIEHRKKRATSEAIDVHWHVLVGEVDPVTGRVLKSSFDRVKHELISRICESTFGHPFVLGKHTATVIKALRLQNLDFIANRLEAVFDPATTLPAEAFTHAQHQEKKRLGIDLPGIRQFVRDAVNDAVSGADLTSKLTAAGLEARPGDKPGTWIIIRPADGILIGALHRLGGKRKCEINILLEDKRPSRGNVATTPTDDTAAATSRGGSPAISANLPTVERLIEALIKLEQAALRDLDQPIPSYQHTQAKIDASNVVRSSQKDFSMASNRRSELQQRMWNTPRIRWWHHLFGVASRHQTHIRELEISLKEAEADFGKKEIAVSIALQREFREERAAKQAHAAFVGEIAQRQQQARHTLSIVEEARIVLDELPGLSSKGLDFVLSKAKLRLRQSQQIEIRLQELAEGSTLGRGSPSV